MVDEKTSYIGGARIGLLNATWPFAHLTVAKDYLNLNVGLLGYYSFLPNQVISIDQVGIIPFLAWGIRINHTVSSYPNKIIFWHLGNPSALIDKIQSIGFLQTKNSIILQTKNTSPIRWHIILVLIVIWNFLFFLDIGIPPRFTSVPGWFSFTAIFLVFIGSLGMRHFLWIQKIILKPNRSPNEIQNWLNLLPIISGTISFVLFIFLFARYLG